jgi:hypothetical protein
MDELTVGSDDSSRLTPYRDYINPNHSRNQLTPMQMERFNLMLQAKAWQVSFLSRGRVAKKLQEQTFMGKALSQSAAYGILKDSDHVFGKYDQIYKEAARSINYERLEKALELIWTDKDTSGTVKAMAIAKVIKEQNDLLGLYKDEGDLDADSLMPPTTIIFKGSNQVLINGQN